jgi:hypothetical protein
LPKSTELGVFEQEGLNAIAFKLNTRPRKNHGFKTLSEIYAELLIKAQDETSTEPPRVSRRLAGFNHTTVEYSC